MARKKTPPSRFVRSASNRSTGSRGSTRSRSRSRKNSGTTTLPSATNFRRSSSNRSNGSRISTASRVSTASVGSTKSNSSGKNNLSKVQTPYAIRRSSSNRSTVSKSHKKKKDLKKKATTEITRPAPPPRESSDKSQPGCKNTENSKGSLKVRTRSLSPRKSVKSPAGFGVSSPGFIKPINFQEMSRVRSPLGGVTNASKSISPPRSNQIRRNSRSPFQAPAGSSQSVYSIGKTKGQSRKVVTSRKKGISPSKKGVRLHGSPKKNKSKNMFATNKKLNRRPFLRQGRIGKPELNPKSKKIVTKRIGDVDVAVPTPVMPSKSHKKEFNAGVIEKKKRSVGKKKAGQDSRQKKVVHMEKKGDSKSDLSGFYTDDEIAVINDTGSLTKLKVVNEEEQSELSNSSSDSDMSDDSKKGLEHYNYYKEKAYNLRKTTSAPLNRTSSKKDEMGLRWCRKGDLYLRQGDDRLAINAYHTSLHATKSSLQFGVSPLLASDYDKKAARKLVSGLLVKAQKDLETRAIKTEGNGASNSSEDENELVSTVTSEDQSEAKPMLFDNSGTLRKRMESCSKALDEYTDSLEKYRKRVCLSDYVRRKRRILEDKMRLYQEELEKTHSRTGQLLPRVADLLLEIGSAHEKRGNISSAVAFYQEGIRVRKASLADDYRKLTLKNLGVATVNDKENDRAVEALITSLHRCRESGEKKYPFLENSDLFRELTVSPNNDVGCTKPDFDKYDWSLPEINWGAFKFPSTFSEFKGLFMLNEEQIDDVSTILTKEAKEVPGISRYNLKYLLKEAVKDFGVGLGAFGEAFDLNDTTIDKFVKGIVSATPTFIRPVPDHDDYYLSFSSGSFFSESECSFDSRDYSRMSPPPMSSRMSPRMSRSRSENTGMRDYRSTKEYRSSRRGRHYNRINSISTSGTYDVDSEDDSSFVSGASIGSWLAMGMGKKAGEIVDTMDKTTGYGFNNENILVARSISTILSKTRSEPSVAPKGRNLHEQGSEESEETTKFHNVSRKEGKNKKQSKKRLKKRKKKNEIEEDATFESVPLGVSTTSHGSF